MPDMPKVALNQGQNVEGFQVKRVTPLPGLRAVAYDLEHQKTGAQVVHIHTNDTENLFGVIFPTPPEDDTGLPHILEHAVLGGSKKYPVKDPFFEMIKSSMATFINAFTASDATYYPVSSNVRQDFYNLAEVYWDAVFHPTLSEMTFKREGHRLEFATRNDPASELMIQGIVYNEMKGAYSSPNSLVMRKMFRSLFPDTIYGRDSGGDPEAIPQLTFEQFKRFHQRYYHPSNARIFLYGDIRTADHLKFLAERLEPFHRSEPAPAIPPQPRWSEPRAATERYPVGPQDDLSRKTYITAGWLVGDALDVQEVMAFEVLEKVLLGHHGAPLRRALIESHLGDDLTPSGFSWSQLHSTFHAGLKGSEPDRADAVLKVILDTLRQIAEDGIPAEHVDAAFQQMAYEVREIGSQFPLRVMFWARMQWLYGGDPLTLMRADELLEEVKQRWQADPQLFGNLIRDKLLDNAHRILIIFIPDPNLSAERERRFKAQMQEMKQKLSADDVQRIIREAEELEQELARPNPPEALATLPQLKVADLPRKPRHIPTLVERLNDRCELLRNDVFANGVNYLHLGIDLSALPEELYAYLPLYGQCASKMGAAGMDYVRMGERTAASTGGVGFAPEVRPHVAQPQITLRQGRFTMKFLDEKTDDALKVLRDLLFELDVRDIARLKDVIMQIRIAHRSSIVENGLAIGMAQAGRGLDAAAFLGHRMGGLPQIRLIESLAQQFDQQTNELIGKLEAIRAHLCARGRITASFTGSDSVHEKVRHTLHGWSQRFGAEAGQERPPAFEPWDKPPREGLAGPMEVAFCTQVLQAPNLAQPDAPLIMVGARLVGMSYALEEIRFKGAAYGGGATYDGTHWRFYSYRDPWVTRTLEVFRKSLDYVRTAEWSQGDVDRAIIGTAKEGERPIRPGEATATALTRHLTGDTPQRREQRHAGVLAATPAAVRQATQRLLEQNMDSGGVCVVSSREKLEQANKELGDRGLTIEDIL
jgi:presequence protease